MDFFAHQARARRRSALLVAYFLLAVIALVALIYATATLAFASTATADGGLFRWRPDLFLTIAAATLTTIALGSLYRLWSLRAGGRAVAELLGGVPLTAPPHTRLERRLRDVVEEMAIASGVPVPAIYVLPEEPGINAFAAGHDWGDAVIAVSAGALHRLDRAELQGVVAHEFSHVFHGDMRLNLRLMGLLHGIQVIALGGELLMRAAPRNRDAARRHGATAGAGIALFGFALFVAGWAGVFFAGLIKAAVSRQREFLADAAAVQYTRNRDGIGGALAKIGGLAAAGGPASGLHAARAREVSHFLFAHGDDTPSRLDRLMATHPPLRERLGRLYALPGDRWRDAFPEIGDGDWEADEFLPGHTASRLASSAPTSRAAAPDDPDGLAAARGVLDALPPRLREAAAEPVEAGAVVYALLIATDPEVMQAQHQYLQEHAERDVYRALWRVGPEVRGMSPTQLLPLLDLLAGTLIALSPRQYRGLRKDCAHLIARDGQLDPTEFALREILLRHLDRHFQLRAAPKVRYHALSEVLGPVALVLSSFAWRGHPDDEAAARAAFAAAVIHLRLPVSTPLLAEARCTLRALGHAFEALRETFPEPRQAVIEACRRCVAHDGRITLIETELLRAIAAALELPNPPPGPPSDPRAGRGRAA